jgi:zinc-ribbon domain
MSDFVESAKNMLGSAISRTGWEAQKQMRVRGKQGEIDKLMEQRRQLLEDMVQVTMGLYTQGALHDPQLSRVCASILELDNDVEKREQQLQEIKSETYQAQQPATTPDYTPPAYTPPYTPPTPPTGQPNTSKAQPKAGAQWQTCPTCGNSVRANSLYCGKCGTKMR